MDTSWEQNLDLLDLHGRAAAAALSRLQPDEPVPPRAETAAQVAQEHWATLEIWSWSVANPQSHWGDRDEPPAPAGHDECTRAIGVELDRLEDSLRAAGPDRELDFFGETGTTAMVARLLAHEAIVVAHRASLAAGRQSPAISAPVAVDVVSRALLHWAEPTARVRWHSEPALLRATDTGNEWYVAHGQGAGGEGAIRPGTPGTPGLDITGTAINLAWWLHGLDAEVSIEGPPEEARSLLASLDLPTAPQPRRWWRR